MAQAHEGVERAHDAAVRQLLELEVALAGDALERTGTEEHGALDLLLGELRDLVGGHAADDALGEVGGGLQLGALGLERLHVLAEEAGHEHRGKAAGHREAAVVGPVREHDDEVLARLDPLGEFAVRVAGDDQVMGTGAEFVGHLIGGDALGAVARAAEGNEKLRGMAEEIGRGGHDVRRGHGLGVDEARLHVLAHGRVRDISGRAGAGQDDFRVFVDRMGRQERLDVLLLAQNNVVSVHPHLRLMGDLTDCVTIKVQHIVVYII